MTHCTPHSLQSIDQDDLSDTEQMLLELVEDQAERIDDLEQRVEDLEDQLADERQERTEADARDRQRITDVEQRLEDVEADAGPKGSDPERGPVDGRDQPQTPIEQLARLPQEMLEQETANVRRSVFVGRDASDYTTKVPAGRAIRSGELRRVLKAGTDAKGHSQTVDRVIQTLDDLGGDDVEVVERRGERRVVFSDELVERLEAQAAHRANHDVVTEAKV